MNYTDINKLKKATIIRIIKCYKLLNELQENMKIIRMKRFIK